MSFLNLLCVDLLAGAQPAITQAGFYFCWMVSTYLHRRQHQDCVKPGPVSFIDFNVQTGTTDGPHISWGLSHCQWLYIARSRGKGICNNAKMFSCL